MTGTLNGIAFKDDPETGLRVEARILDCIWYRLTCIV